jgi:hypothetical protein
MASVVASATDRLLQPQDASVDLGALFHRLNNQLGVILAHAELLEKRLPDAGERSRATRVITGALEALGIANEIRSRIENRPGGDAEPSGAAPTDLK